MTPTAPTAPEDLVYNHPGVRLHLYAGTYPLAHGRRPLAHWHDDFEMILVRSGLLACQVAGEDARLGPGDFLFVNGGQIHRYDTADGARCDYDCVIVHPAILGCEPGLRERLVEPVRRRADLPFAVWRNGAAGAVPERMEAILRVEEEARNLPWTPAEAAGLVFRLWAEVVRLLPGPPSPAAAIRRAGEDADGATDEATAARAMVSFIRRHYPERLSLGRIAAAGCVCRSRCCRIFRRQLRQSPIAYLNAFRMEVALRLLRETASSVADIAAACGFAHQSYFTQQFKATHGVTPARWRRDSASAAPSP